MRSEFVFHEGDTSGELLRTIKEYISRYPNGVTVVVEPFKSRRTDKQNALYQLYVKRISAQSGYPTDAVKMMVKDMAVGYGYPVEKDEDGEPILQYGNPIPLSTSKANVEEMEKILECCHMIASKFDYVLDDR